MKRGFRGFLILMRLMVLIMFQCVFLKLLKFQGQGIGRPILACLHSQKLSKVPNLLHRSPDFSTGFRAKGSHLRASTLVCTPTHRLSTRSHVGYTSPHGNDGKVHARHTARVRAQMDGWPLSPLTPQSLTTPQLRHRSNNLWSMLLKSCG